VSLFVLVWLVAIGLMSFSLATMTALICARVVREHQKTRRAARRAIVLPELVHHVGGLVGDETLDLHGLEKDAVLMAEVVRDLAGLVLGPERQRLMEALQALKVDQTLRRLLRAGSVVHRVLAAEALIFFPGEETYTGLLRAVRRDDPRVRLAALRTVIELGRAPPVNEMLDAVIGGSERASLLFSDLLQRATRTQIDGAIEALKRKDLPVPVRVMVMQALGATRDKRAFPALKAATKARDPEIRAGALGSLAALGHTSTHKLVADALVDEDWRVRLKAIECVRKLGLTEFFARVMVLSNDEVWWVRYRAGQTLMSLADDDIAKLKRFAKKSARFAPRSPRDAAGEPRSFAGGPTPAVAGVPPGMRNFR
jgi:HEAT repeat protein